MRLRENGRRLTHSYGERRAGRRSVESGHSGQGDWSGHINNYLFTCCSLRISQGLFSLLIANNYIFFRYQCVILWMRERKKCQEKAILSLVQPTDVFFCTRTGLGWCFCVCVSHGLFHQSGSINSSNTARLLRSIMCYITSSKCTLRPHQHQQLGCYLL